MMKGFSFELYETEFTKCFIHSSFYANGDLQLSLFGIDPELDEVAHFADITLEQNIIELKENEIVVDCKFKPTLIPQLEELGILDKQVGICPIKDMLYPIYTINLDTVTRETILYASSCCIGRKGKK